MVGEIRLQRCDRRVAVSDGLTIRSVYRRPVVLRFFDPEVRPLSRVHSAINLGDVIALRLNGGAQPFDVALRYVDIEKRAIRQSLRQHE